MLASNKCCLVENLTGTTQAERRNGASPPGASTCLTSSSGTATPSTSTHCCQLQVVSCTCRADICHDRHYRQWCTLFKPMYFFLKRTQNLGPFCPILSQIYALFGVLFTGLNSMVGCQNWQTSGMCTCIGITVHPHQPCHPFFLTFKNANYTIFTRLVVVMFTDVAIIFCSPNIFLPFYSRFLLGLLNKDQKFIPHIEIWATQ